VRWPNLFDELEIHSFENLRGISKEINPDVHLSRIRIEWNKFYNLFPPGGAVPTRQQILDKAEEIDDLFGHFFSPPIRKIP